MADISPIDHPRRIPVILPVPSYLRDHCFNGTAVLPAVETLQVLAETVRAACPRIDIFRQAGAAFRKFLYIKPEDRVIEALVDVTPESGGQVVARLITRAAAGTSGMIRTKEHAVVRFAGRGSAPPGEFGEGDVAAAGFRVSAERLYADLVPFGPAYHNVVDEVRLNRRGGFAVVAAPETPRSGLPAPLGSPFPLDAAFHAACAWGQRFAGVVAFPVGFDHREIMAPTRSGQRYHCRIIPIGGSAADGLRFNLRLSDLKDQPIEHVCGVVMRDVSGGRMKPPRWITDQEGSS